MATINNVLNGLKLLSQSCDANICKVTVVDHLIIAGVEEEVLPGYALLLRASGWTVGEFGWEISCD